MDDLQKRRAETQHPLTWRKPRQTNSVGGRAVAYTVTPSTFPPLPAPLKTSQPPPKVPKSVVQRLAACGDPDALELLEAAKRKKREAGLRKTETNNARQALLKRPRGPVPVQRPDMCPLCGAWFPSRNARGQHQHTCIHEAAD